MIFPSNTHTCMHMHTHTDISASVLFKVKSSTNSLLLKESFACIYLVNLELSRPSALLKMATAHRWDTTLLLMSLASRTGASTKLRVKKWYPGGTTWGQINVRWLTVFITTCTAGWCPLVRSCLVLTGGGNQTTLRQFPLSSKTHHLQEQSPGSHCLSWRNSW